MQLHASHRIEPDPVYERPIAAAKIRDGEIAVGVYQLGVFSGDVGYPEVDVVLHPGIKPPDIGHPFGDHERVGYVILSEFHQHRPGYADHEL